MLWKTNSDLLCNFRTAEQRYVSLAKRLRTDKEFETMYSSTINSYFEKGYAKKLTENEKQQTSQRTWYVPHHGLKNPNKPGKVLVVFDAAAKHVNVSLNNMLMTGPDLSNSLIGVFLRFRLNNIALVTDIKEMFHQVKVPSQDSDSLRFMWSENQSYIGRPEIYKMTVHIFGAADSPSIANYALQSTASDNREYFTEAAIKTVERDFYVDDVLKSVDTVAEAVKISGELPNILKCRGFCLHKWMSNSKEVLQSVDGNRDVGVFELELDNCPIHRTLGMKWNVKEDTFVFSPDLKSMPHTKRGVVSIVSSIFDSFGLISPFILRGKCIMQELWRRGIEWDEVIPEDVQVSWIKWLSEVEQLSQLKIPTHHILFSSSNSAELYMFSDASEKAFGAVAYLLYEIDNDIKCSFLASKTRVAPLKPMLSIPRLELQAAILSVRL